MGKLQKIYFVMFVSKKLFLKYVLRRTPKSLYLKPGGGLHGNTIKDAFVKFLLKKP